jgi:hypothetical protein
LAASWQPYPDRRAWQLRPACITPNWAGSTPLAVHRPCSTALNDKRAEPPFCTDIGSKPIMMLAAQIQPFWVLPW